MIRKSIDVSIKAWLNKIKMSKAFDCNINLKKIISGSFELTKPHEILKRNEREEKEDDGRQCV